MDNVENIVGIRLSSGGHDYVLRYYEKDKRFVADCLIEWYRNPDMPFDRRDLTLTLQQLGLDVKEELAKAERKV